VIKYRYFYEPSDMFASSYDEYGSPGQSAHHCYKYIVLSEPVPLHRSIPELYQYVVRIGIGENCGEWVRTDALHDEPQGVAW
jgi:hypothetical protein